MYNLTRWEPIHEMMTLHEEMDRLFDDAFTRPLCISAGSAISAISGWGFILDITLAPKMRDNDYTVRRR